MSIRRLAHRFLILLLVIQHAFFRGIGSSGGIQHYREWQHHVSGDRWVWRIVRFWDRIFDPQPVHCYTSDGCSIQHFDWCWSDYRSSWHSSIIRAEPSEWWAKWHACVFVER